MLPAAARASAPRNAPTDIADRVRSNVAMMDIVQRNMLNTSILSWEYGTAAQAMLEYNYGSLGIYGSAPIPLPAGTPRASVR